MAISLKTYKMLWGRSANRCSFCRKELVMDATETDDFSLIGEACHIVAQSDRGPRGSAVMDDSQRDKFANLILLCNIHHKQIDDQPNTFTEEILKEKKLSHEEWVRSQLNFDSRKQKEDEIYAEYIDEFTTRINIDDWQNWTSYILFGGQPTLDNDQKCAIKDIQHWILSRVWPGRYLKLEAALINFRLVAQDFIFLFIHHAEQINPDREWRTIKFYKNDQWDAAGEQKRVEMYDAHVALVQDLMLELTRAVNYVCDMVRIEFISSFRMKEGVVLVEGGPYSDLSFRTYRAEYRGGERIDRPYPGLSQFKDVRFSRDHCLGHKSDNAVL